MADAEAAGGGPGSPGLDAEVAQIPHDILPKDEAVPCYVCRIFLNGPLQYQDHLRSRFHRKRLKGARAARGAGRPSGAGEAGTSSSSGAQEAEADEAPERPPALRAGRPYAQGGPDKLG